MRSFAVTSIALLSCLDGTHQEGIREKINGLGRRLVLFLFLEHGQDVHHWFGRRRLLFLVVFLVLVLLFLLLIIIISIGRIWRSRLVINASLGWTRNEFKEIGSGGGCVPKGIVLDPRSQERVKRGLGMKGIEVDSAIQYMKDGRSFVRNGVGNL